MTQSETSRTEISEVLYKSGERFDLYKVMHKYIRSEINNVTEECGSLDFTDIHERAAFKIRFYNLFELLSSHAENEDSYIGPLLEEIDSPKTANLRADHKQLENLSLDLKQALDSLLNSVEVHEKPLNDFYLKLVEFQAVYFNHLNFEEITVTSVLHENFSDERLRHANAKMLKNMPSERFVDVTTGMLRKINHQERLAIYTELKKAMPLAVFSQMYQLAKTALPDNQFQKLSSALSMA